MSQPKNMQKSKNMYQPNLKVFQSPSQQYQNMIYSNNNNNLFNYNIKVNKLKNPPKEKIIEGELNFNDKKVHRNKISNHSKNKKIRNKPRKSPIPLPKDYKPSNFPYQKLFNNNYYMHNSNNFKPKSAYPKSNNSNNVKINNKNGNKPNTFGINSIFPSNKTYNTFNIFKKNLERTHSPLLRTSGTNNGINFMQKGAVKSRYISKSPILSKGSIFNRYKMYGFVGHSNSTSSSSITNNQKNKKKTPIKNNKKKSSGIPKHNNVNQVYNVNNLRSKGPTFISGELIQDSSNNGKININRINNNNVNNNNSQNMNQTNINKNRNINNNNNNNNEHANIMPIYNPNNLKIDSNNALLNIHAEVNINANKEKENLKKNIQSNENKNRNNENANANSGNFNNFNNFNNIKENRNEESKKSNQRSQSTGIVNPLQKSHDKEEIKEQKLNKEIPVKEKEIPIKEKEIPIKENIKVRKIIRDILPYTHVGFDGEEPKENNQDNYFIYKNFMKKKDYIYMSVCDGHGAEGHFVSDFIKETLPYDMSENLKNMNILTENEKEKNKIYQIITETFIIANEKLVENEEINSLFSGSTCVSVIYTPEKLIVPNIGDSRAVLGRLINKENNEYKAINLSRDHKPTEKDEAQRIIENDGRIQPFTEEGEFVGPERVWIKEEDVPGLAMTRSFGDRVAATVGVMSEPEIKEFDFDENDKFMIIASDGIWEFISSQECVDIIKNFYDKNELKECCEYLYQESSKRWLKEEEVIDDTTLILVFFE